MTKDYKHDRIFYVFGLSGTLALLFRRLLQQTTWEMDMTLILLVVK